MKSYVLERNINGNLSYYYTTEENIMKRYVLERNINGNTSYYHTTLRNACVVSTTGVLEAASVYDEEEVELFLPILRRLDKRVWDKVEVTTTIRRAE